MSKLNQNVPDLPGRNRSFFSARHHEAAVHILQPTSTFAVVQVEHDFISPDMSFFSEIVQDFTQLAERRAEAEELLVLRICKGIWQAQKVSRECLQCTHG
jgi:hypothetical protein